MNIYVALMVTIRKFNYQAYSFRIVHIAFQYPYGIVRIILTVPGSIEVRNPYVVNFYEVVSISP